MVSANCWSQLHQSNTYAQLIRAAIPLYIQYLNLQNSSLLLLQSALIWILLSTLGRGFLCQVPKQEFPKHNSHLFSVRLTPKTLLMHFVQLVDTRTKDFYCLYIGKHILGGKKTGRDMYGEKELSQIHAWKNNFQRMATCC